MSLKKCLIILLLFQAILVVAQRETTTLDVTKYSVAINPDLENQSISGIELITFNISPTKKQVAFDCGNLKISSVKGSQVESFQQKNSQLVITLNDHSGKSIQLQIVYSGTPKRGLLFRKDPLLTYTVFSTDQWMVCNMNPSDRAKLRLEIIVPDTLHVIASGEENKKEFTNGNSQRVWSLENDTPAYTYGFAIGSFREYIQDFKGISLRYYADQYSENELSKVFSQTSEILSFLENKAGIPYSQKSYSQVLAGNHYQEMSGFSMLKDSYGKLVLEDPSETNLITHELAHQWWGNQITCQSWSHFWLNEGLATYMSAAYNEVRFGKEKYQTDIDSYYQVYKKIKEKGSDKPLVFPDWSNPSQDDRNLVYFKGAYVLHLLREELGDDGFWKGVKLYSQENYGKPITTQEFQEAMERATERSLTEFFDEWVY